MLADVRILQKIEYVCDVSSSFVMTLIIIIITSCLKHSSQKAMSARHNSPVCDCRRRFQRRNP